MEVELEENEVKEEFSIDINLTDKDSEYLKRKQTENIIKKIEHIEAQVEPIHEVDVGQESDNEMLDLIEQF